MTRQMAVGVSVILGALVAGCVTTDNYPATTDNGLPRVADKQLDAVYWQPGADLSGYTKIILDPSDVSFRDGWQRDQNAERRSPSSWVKDEDMDRIRTQLAEQVNEVFTKELSADGGFAIVTEPGPDVLRVTPEILDLDVYAPDVMEPSRTRTFVREAGRMTIQLDVADAATGQPIGRIIDNREARDNGTLRNANSVTNRFEANKMLRRWATILRDRLTVSS